MCTIILTSGFCFCDMVRHLLFFKYKTETEVLDALKTETIYLYLSQLVAELVYPDLTTILALLQKQEEIIYSHQIK